MIKKLIVVLLLLVAADYAFNGGEYTSATMAKLSQWSSAAKGSVKNSIFAQ